MKTKLFMLALVVVAMFIAAPAYAATCPISSTVAALQALPTCTLGPSDIVTFSGFTTTLPGTTVVTVVLNSASNPGSVGFTFDPGNGSGSTAGYTVAYNAMCSAACVINGGSDSHTENPANGGVGGSSNYQFTIGPNTSGTTQVNFTTSFSGVSLANITNQGVFAGNSGTNQSITLDINFAPPSGVPEPTSLLLFGSGFLALGLVARIRTRRS